MASFFPFCVAQRRRTFVTTNRRADRLGEAEGKRGKGMKGREGAVSSSPFLLFSSAFHVIVAAALLFPACALASAEEFSVRSKVISPPEMGTLTCYEIALGSRRFEFVPPSNWRPETEVASCTLRFRRVTRQATFEIILASSRDEESAVDALALQPAGGAADGSIRERIDQLTGIGSGKGADAAWTMSGVSMRSRAVSVRLLEGSARFLLVCPAEDFDGCQRMLGAVMTSFQAVSSSSAAE